jgi:2-amino-4-hydroxy-6-hydroxymethyldihydropteridine diphosphokinase
VAEVVVGLGSNLGDRVGQLTSAVRSLASVVTRVRLSSLWETEPVGLRDQPYFLNAVLIGHTDRPPRALLATFVDLEQRLGRGRRTPNGPRTIDLDLIAYDGMTLDEPGLVIPHPRADKRRFVLAPLAEIAPGLRLRTGGATVGEVLRLLPAEEGVAPYPHEDWPPSMT